MSDEKLIPVRDVSELRVGMLLAVRRCLRCGDDETLMILGGPVGPLCNYCDSPGRSVAGHCASDFACFCASISEGRLYRVDDGLTDGELRYERYVFDSETRPRESAKGGVK